jgi:hypothetical protein
MDLDVIKRLLDALEREGVHYAIVGAVALNLHGLARFTRGLYDMKKDTVRLKDRADALALKERFGIVDEELR